MRNSYRYASWAAPQQDYNEMPAPELLAAGFPAPSPQTFDNQTVRQVVRLSAGGDGVRIKLSNLFGAGPVTFSGVRLAKSQGGWAIDPGSDTGVTFGGQNSLTLAAGAEQWSDEITLPLQTNTELAVSMFFAGSARVATSHSLGKRTNYLTSGNALSAATCTGAKTVQSYYWLAGVDVSGTHETNVIVAFGDSITDGEGSTADANLRYPDQLDELLQSSGTLGRVSVVNSGISANRWLRDGVGPNGAGRFKRDVLDVSGATHVVILLGINDLGMGALIPSQNATADRITAAMAGAIAGAKAKGLKVLVGTILPYDGFFACTDSGEAARQTVNAWIRANETIDAVVDFDLALRDPDNPTRFLALYDSGDHLHPNDTGYLELARTAAAALTAMKKTD